MLHTEVDEAAGATTLTLVLVHGYALNMDCWHFQRKHYRGLVRQVLYDQRSHGRSTRSAKERCRLDQLTVDLEQVLDEVVGDGPVVLLGHSMGGMTIMRLAQTRPELFGSRVRRGRPAAHLGGRDGRPLTDPRAARADLLPGRRAADGRRSTASPSWSSAAGRPAATSAMW